MIVVNQVLHRGTILDLHVFGLLCELTKDSANWRIDITLVESLRWLMYQSCHKM